MPLRFGYEYNEILETRDCEDTRRWGEMKLACGPLSLWRPVDEAR